MDKDGGVGKVHNARTSVTRPLSVYTVGGEPTRQFHMDAIVWSEAQRALVFRRGLQVKSVPWDAVEKAEAASSEPLPDTSDAIAIVGGDGVWSESDSYADGLRRRLAAAIFWDPDRPSHTAPRLPKGRSANVRVSERGEILSITGDTEVVERVRQLPGVRPITWRQGEWGIEIEFNRMAAMTWIRDVWSRIGS